MVSFRVAVSALSVVNGGAFPTEALDRVTLLAGSYLVRHAATAALCVAGQALPGVPCASQVLAGCPRP